MGKNNKFTKIMALLALFGIIIGIVGTGLLIIFGGQNTQKQTLSPEEYTQLQELINSQTGSINTSTGTMETLTGIVDNSTGVIEVSTGSIE